MSHHDLYHEPPAPGTVDWRHNGVRVIKGNQLDPNTPQTPGMNRAAAITHARVGAEKIWAGTVTIHPNPKTGAHHNAHADAPLECVLVRSDQEPVVINLDIQPIEQPEAVFWVDPGHPPPGSK